MRIHLLGPTPFLFLSVPQLGTLVSHAKTSFLGAFAKL
jgi:hypothetical protein